LSGFCDNKEVLGLLRSEKVHCVFCKLPHRIYKQRDVGYFDIVVLLAIAGIFTTLVWQQPDLRSLILFTSMAVSMEIFIRMRWRNSVKCPHCGFDPLVYKADPDQAALKVKAFLERRKNDPKYLLKPKPQIKPIINKSEDWRNNLPVVTEDKLEHPETGRITDYTI
jgi:hypothetical protein